MKNETVGHRIGLVVCNFGGANGENKTRIKKNASAISSLSLHRNLSLIMRTNNNE